MKRAVPTFLALGLASCAGPEVRGSSHPAPPQAPAWASAPTVGREVRAVGREDLPAAAPERLLRDLADARACDLVRDSFATRAAEGLRRLRPEAGDSLPARLKAAILRTPFPGCAIARREIRDGAQGRRWCWAQAILDTGETLPVLERELRRGAAVIPGRSPLDLLDRTRAPTRAF